MLRWVSSYFALIIVFVLARPGLAAGDEPLLIRKAPDAIQDAWRRVAKLLKDNDKLPDAYLARAEIWSKVGNYDEALADQLTALELFYRGSPTVIEEARFLRQLEDTIKLFNAMPRPYFPLEADQRYYLGKAAYFECDFNVAIKELTEAIRLQPQEPIYWLFRALAFNKLGKKMEAERDSRAGGSLWRARKAKKDTYQELERIQGELRAWLSESCRQKSPSSRRLAVTPE